MKYNNLLFRLLALALLAFTFQACVEDDDFDVPEIPEVPPVEEVQEILSEGGSAAAFTACLTEDFEAYETDVTTFDAYENISTLDSRLWEVAQFSGNKYLKMSAYQADADVVSYFVIPVNFDEADSFSFKTQDRFNNGDALQVYLVSNYEIANNIVGATVQSITDQFTIATGTTGSASQPWVESGSYDLSSVTGNGFIAFKYVGNGDGVTTTMHIDDIKIVDNEDANCGGSGSSDACKAENFDAYTDGDTNFPGYQAITTTGSKVWAINEYSDNRYAEFSAYQADGAQEAWFIMGVNFDSATGFAFDTKDGYNNGDPLTVHYSTDYNEQGDPTTATWNDITSEFAISHTTGQNWPDDFTQSGTYNFSGLSGNGYIAFKYNGAGDGVTTTIQVDNVEIFGTGNCTFDLQEVASPTQIHQGGGSATPLACALEDFTSFDAGTTDFPAYEGIALMGDKFWEVKEFGGNKYAQFSAYNNAEHDVWMLVNVNFDQADTFSFLTKDGFNNGDALTVWYSTAHTVGEDVDVSEWTDITSEFTLATGTSTGYADDFTASGDYSLAGISGNGFIAFRYQGNNDGGVTTTFQIDDIKITDAEDADCNDGTGTENDLFISEYAEGSSNNKYIEIYNGTGADVDLSAYMLKGSNNGSDWKPERDLQLSGTLAAGDVYVVATDAADQLILDAADLALAYESPVHYNGDDAIGLFKDGALIDVVGIPTEDPGSGWEVAGVADGTKDHTLVRKSNITTGNTDWAASAGTSTDDSEWEVLDQNDWTYIGAHPGTAGGGGGSGDLYISEYAEGSSNNKYIEIYNGTGADVDLSAYMVRGSNNGGDWKPERDLQLSGTLAAGGIYIISTDAADQSILDVADLSLPYESPVHYNGDDAIGLFKDGNLIDIIGVPTEDPGSGWEVAGVADATKDHTLVRKASVTAGNTDWAASAGTSADDSEWTVLDKDDWSNIDQR